MTRREKIVQCVDNIENGQIRLQEHVQNYGSTGMSELLAWICVGMRLILEKELKETRGKEVGK